MRFARVVFLLFLVSPAWARYEAEIMQNYNGRYHDTYLQELDRVRILVHQAQLEVSSRLGLIQYQQGFQYPMAIRFDDTAPAGTEHALAYVQLLQAQQGNEQDFAQQLVVNLSAMAKSDADIDKVFYHEMTHAVLNDAVGGEASEKIPPWVQEGLAQYISDEGKEHVEKAASHYKKSQVQGLLYALDGPYTGRAYPQYYLAIECLYEKHSVNAVQALVRELIDGKPTIDAIEDVTGLTWDQFKQEVHDYSLQILQDKARPDF